MNILVNLMLFVNPISQPLRCLRQQHAKGRWPQLTRSLRYVLNLWRYRSVERVLNYSLFRWKTATGAWKRLQTEGEGHHRIFYSCTTADSNHRLIVKVPRADSSYSWAFVRSLRGRSVGDDFKHILQRACSDRFLERHCARLVEARPSGCYISEFVSGPNLDYLRRELFNTSVLPATDRVDFIGAVKTLIHDLQGYQRENGSLIGDWALQNLVYSRERSAIVNVDLEGFYTFQSGARALESDISYINDLLEDIIALVQMRQSVEPFKENAVRALELIDEVRKSETAYSGALFLAGYHSMRLGQHEFRGQRECVSRLRDIPFDFRGKVVVDFGCNSGGMLHALAPIIKAGYGFDFNAKCINAANAVKRANGTNNLDFYQFDLDRDDLRLISTHFMQGAADVALLLSVCMWLSRWSEVVKHVAGLVDTLVFETNGTPEQQTAQENLLAKCYYQVDCLSESSSDDPLQPNRRLYLCRNSKIDT